MFKYYIVLLWITVLNGPSISALTSANSFYSHIYLMILADRFRSRTLQVYKHPKTVRRRLGAPNI